MTNEGDSRRQRFLASLEEDEAFWGVRRFRLWLTKRDAARSRTSWLARRLSWKARAASISILTALFSSVLFIILGEPIVVCVVIPPFMGVAVFLFQANWYFQLPEVASGGTLGSLLWTLLLGLAVGTAASGVMVWVVLTFFAR